MTHSTKISLVLAAALFLPASRASAVDVESFFATIIGYVLSRTVHDSGQGAAATLYGWKVTSFKPYPTTCEATPAPNSGNKPVKSFALSCVTYRPQDNIDFTDPNEIKRFHNEDAAIIASGAFANHVTMLAVLPFMKHVSPKGFIGHTLMSILAVQYIDFPLTATLAGLGSPTEWATVADDKGFQKSYLIAPGILDYYLMGKYFEHFGHPVGFLENDRVEPDEPSAPPSPRYAWMPEIIDRGHGVTSYGAAARFNF